MSVIKSERKTSELEFLHTARELQIFSIQKCSHFPKRYTFYISQPLANVATRIHQNVKLGNSIYPTNQHEVQIRLDYFLKAKAECNNMVSQIEVAKELFDVDTNIIRDWMQLVSKEIKLISALIKTDRARYKNLP
jgi:hypothetical protein